MTPPIRHLFVPLAAMLCLSSVARAQLRQDEVLVVYDSRSSDSLDVARYYAGSARVGGTPGIPGARPGVWVFDLAASGAAIAPPGDISYADFVAKIRDPLRTFLSSNQLARRVRCLVLTKGMPHRILDTDAGAVGDSPGNLVNEFTANDATCASVDSELTLLWQNLNTGEAGGNADSRSDGLVLNPYWKLTQPLYLQPNTNIQVAKNFAASGMGPVWVPFGPVGSTRITAGDILLVSRLDGLSLADVHAIIDRAQSVYLDPSSAIAILDESDSNGIADPGANAELDNQNSANPQLWGGDDFEQARDDLLADGRFPASFTQYNALGGGSQFFVGPRIAWTPPVLLVSQNVFLLATYGSNHTGFPRDSAGTLAFSFYASSYNYANGAIFNTVESYNGRNFGGIGPHPSIAQQQIVDFLAAGGTFGLGNVWEPFADSIPDNHMLVQNFVRGNLCWGEAAWSSVPGLSWMQLVVGDPLARVQRRSEDINADSRVGVDDLYAWEASPSDIDHSGAADNADRSILLGSIRAAERPEMLAYRP